MKRSRSNPQRNRDEEFWQRLDEISRAHDEIQKRRVNILRLQRELRSVVDERAWQIYLTLEAETNERDALLLELLKESFEHEDRGSERKLSLPLSQSKNQAHRFVNGGMRYRIFEMYEGWGEWKSIDLAFGEGSDVIALEIVKRERPELEDPVTSNGFSLTKTDQDGRPGDQGIAFVLHTKGLICVELGR